MGFQTESPKSQVLTCTKPGKKAVTNSQTEVLCLLTSRHCPLSQHGLSRTVSKRPCSVSPARRIWGSNSAEGVMLASGSSHVLYKCDSCQADRILSWSQEAIVLKTPQTKTWLEPRPHKLPKPGPYSTDHRHHHDMQFMYKKFRTRHLYSTLIC